MTPSDMERAVRSTSGSASRSDIRNAIRELVSEGRIFYTQHHSTTHLEINFNRPVQVGGRIVLCPSTCSVPDQSDRIIVKLRDGTAFGGGDHPTTRLMLQAMALLLNEDSVGSIQRALDIGTGTGVLAIASAVLGVSRVDAVDIDPVACHEANQNVLLNGVDHRVQISSTPLDESAKVTYDLVLANLRPPTILKLLPIMKILSSPFSTWIISGCRLDEAERLRAKLPERFKRVIWQADRTGWTAFAVRGSGE